MSSNLDKFEKIKAEAAKAKTARDRAKGAVDSLTAAIKRDHGCEDIKEAKEKLARLKEQESILESKLDSELSTFVKQWGEFI